MIELNDEVRASLLEAGIGKRFHDLSLNDVEHGKGMLAYLTQHGKAFRSGRSVAFHGVGATDAILMLARALHVNGIGCRVVPLVRLRQFISSPEFREAVDDADVLVILNAQDTRRGNPLHDSVAAEVEYQIRRRVENNRAVIMQLAVPEDQSIASMDNCYWSDEMLALMDMHFDKVTLGRLKQMGETK